MFSLDTLPPHRVTWILVTKCSATIISLMINPPVSQKTGKSTTSEYCVTCRSFLDTWLHLDCSTTSQEASGNSSGILNWCFCLDLPVAILTVADV